MKSFIVALVCLGLVFALVYVNLNATQVDFYDIKNNAIRPQHISTGTYPQVKSGSSTYSDNSGKLNNQEGPYYAVKEDVLTSTEALNVKIDTETANRISQDQFLGGATTQLKTDIDNETVNRQNADSLLGQTTGYLDTYKAVKEDVFNSTFTLNTKIDTHTGATAGHGVGTVIGSTETQTLTNKTLSSGTVLPSAVMLEGEGVSGLSNDSGYTTAIATQNWKMETYVLEFGTTTGQRGAFKAVVTGEGLSQVYFSQDYHSATGTGTWQAVGTGGAGGSTWTYVTERFPCGGDVFIGSTTKEGIGVYTIIGTTYTLVSARCFIMYSATVSAITADIIRIPFANATTWYSIFGAGNEPTITADTTAGQNRWGAEFTTFAHSTILPNDVLVLHIYSRGNAGDAGAKPGTNFVLYLKARRNLPE